MREFLTESVYFGAVLTLAAFEIGKHVKKKYRLGVLNPILIATVLIIGVLNNGLNLMGVDSNWQYIVKGFVILLAVYVDFIRNKKAGR